jgi:DNA-binding HxlR family transcriptional regulator
MNEQHSACARFSEAIELIGGRWSGGILKALFGGQHRFAELRAAVPGVSDTMLVQRLRALGAAGLIERRVIPSTPVRVEYYLTDKGLDLAPVMDALMTWSHKWVALPEDSETQDKHCPGSQSVAQ